jgi:hypothetical protein
MNRRAFLGATLGATWLRIADAFPEAPRATISVDGRSVGTMQAAADAGGIIVLSAGELRSPKDGAGGVVGAAHFRKPVSVVGEGTLVIDQSIEDKGTFIVEADASFAGLDIAGATGDGTGAAFRHQGGDLLIRRTKIHRCENGLLGPAGYVACKLIVDDCDVFDNGTGTGQTHGLYVGAIAAFTCLNSRFRATSIGHHVKSRARRTVMWNCEVGTDFTGNESYNIDVPQGGDVAVDGCHLRQGPRTDNDVLVNYGGERDPHPGGSLTISNTVFESTIGGTGLRVHPNVDVVAILENCAFIGVAIPCDGHCTLRNCTHDGRPLPDGAPHPRRRTSRAPGVTAA